MYSNTCSNTFPHACRQITEHASQIPLQPSRSISISILFPDILAENAQRSSSDCTTSTNMLAELRTLIYIYAHCAESNHQHARVCLAGRSRRRCRQPSPLPLCSPHACKMGQYERKSRFFRARVCCSVRFTLNKSRQCTAAVCFCAARQHSTAVTTQTRTSFFIRRSQAISSVCASQPAVYAYDLRSTV